MEQLKLNMIPNGVNPVFHASQYDKGRQIRFVLDETLSGAEVTVSYRAKDGTEHGNVQTSVSGNTITDTIPEEVLTDYGMIEGEVDIDGIGSLNFFVEVEKDAYDGGVITTQTASGAIATFNTNMVAPFNSLKSDINPLQDLHGYSKPWSGGGGKNKFSNVWSDYTKPNDYRVCPITLTNGQTYKISATLKGTAMNGIVVGIVKDGNYYAEFVGFAQLISSNGIINNISSFTIDNTWVNPKLVIYCSGETQFNQIFANYNIQLEQGSTATDYEPYSNICPISGFSALNVTRTGKNLCFDAYGNKASSGTYLCPSGDNAPIIVNNTLRTAYAYVGKNQDVVVSFANAPQRSIAYGLEAYPSLGVICHSLSVTALSSTSFKLNSGNYDYIAFYYCNDLGNIPSDCQIELGNQATEYHQYNGQTATVNFGQTVYGGVADVTNGKLKITHGIVDLGSLTWALITMGNNRKGFRASLPLMKTVSSSGTAFNAICSNYATLSGNAVYSGSIGISAWGTNATDIGIYDSTKESMSVSDFKTAMSGVMLCYELATPIEITTTPEYLSALSGQTNNVFSDTNGDTEVKYYIEV